MPTCLVIDIAVFFLAGGVSYVVSGAWCRGWAATPSGLNLAIKSPRRQQIRNAGTVQITVADATATPAQLMLDVERACTATELSNFDLEWL